MRILIKTPINKNYREVFSRFNEDLFRALRPPHVPFEIERFDGCKNGDEIHLKISGLKWVSLITETVDNDDEIYFVDEGKVLPPPLKTWRHFHRILRMNDSHSLIIDEIYFSTGYTLVDKALYPVLLAMFMLRKPIYERELT